MQKPAGSINNIGDPIAVLALSDEDWKQVAANAEAFIASESGDASASSETAPMAASASSESAPIAASFSDQPKLPIGPAVRLLLTSYGLTANQISGTGPRGTVLKG